MKYADEPFNMGFFFLFFFFFLQNGYIFRPPTHTSGHFYTGVAPQGDIYSFAQELTVDERRGVHADVADDPGGPGGVDVLDCIGNAEAWHAHLEARSVGRLAAGQVIVQLHGVNPAVDIT